MENETHNKVLFTNDTNLVEFIDSRQQENLESHDMNCKSVIENNEINGLPVRGFKSRDQQSRSKYNWPRTRNSAKKEGRAKILLPRRKICMSMFLILSSNVMICAENKIIMNTNTNSIWGEKNKTTKKELNESSNKTGVQRLDKRHISEDKFKAFKCSEESDISTA